MALRDRIGLTEDDIDAEGSWAISYGDMITLLLTFFVLFFSFDKNKDKTERLNRSLIAELQVMDKEQNRGEKAVLNFGKTKGQNIEKSVIEDWGAKVYQIGQRVIVDFPNTSFFNLGEIRMNAAGLQAIREFAGLYTPYAGFYTLGVRAYTDDRQVLAGKPHRKFADNMELSALRSVSAMRALQDLGLPIAKMRLGGFGELNLDETDRQRSLQEYNDEKAAARKVVFVIEPDSGVGK